MKPWLASMKLCAPIIWVLAIVLPLTSVIVLLGSSLWTELFVAEVNWTETFSNVAQYSAMMFGLGLAIGMLLFLILVPVTRYEIWKNNKVEPKK